MRVLHRIQEVLPIWPFDPLPERGSLIVEIYTSIAALAAGRPRGRTKMTTIEALNAALATIHSEPVPGAGAIDDHGADALLTAAWLRSAADRPELWPRPRSLPSSRAPRAGPSACADARGTIRRFSSAGRATVL